LHPSRLLALASILAAPNTPCQASFEQLQLPVVHPPHHKLAEVLVLCGTNVYTQVKKLSCTAVCMHATVWCGLGAPGVQIAHSRPKTTDTLRICRRKLSAAPA